MSQEEKRVARFYNEFADEMDQSKAELFKKRALYLYLELLKKYPDLPKVQERHVYGAILPAIACYKALLEIEPDRAMKYMETASMNISLREGEMLKKIVSIPGMGRGFVNICRKMTPKMFGEKAGFSFDIISSEPGRFKFNMKKCPYVKYCREEGCYELTHIFCDNDIYSQGNLPKVALNRTQTLGTNGEMCDFEYVLRDKQRI